MPLASLPKDVRFRRVLEEFLERGVHLAINLHGLGRLPCYRHRGRHQEPQDHGQHDGNHHLIPH